MRRAYPYHDDGAANICRAIHAFESFDRKLAATGGISRRLGTLAVWDLLISCFSLS